MTGENYDQMLRDANPHRPATVDLDGADQELLAQIVAEPVRRRLPWALAAAGAAAAVVVAVVVALPATSTSRPEPPAVSVSPSAPAKPKPEPTTASGDVSRAAAGSPRLFPGADWTVIHLAPIGPRQGEMAYRKGDRRLMLTWHPTAHYDTYRKDRYKTKEKVAVADLTGYLVTIGGSGFDVVTEPRDGVFAELRSDDSWTREESRSFLAGFRRVDVPTWIAAVTPMVDPSGASADRVAEALKEVPLPPSWRSDGLGTPETDTAVVRRVVCSWLAEWQRATFDDDHDAAKRAVGALLTSPDWPVVQRMEPGSALPRTIKVVARRMADGQADDLEVDSYRRTFCGQN
ncbi:hypothetical protein [Paractinoplanes atraurantiacus]|uniref:Uncharacterized protein n=1 Tax=Paractinoplanes atraurantiacus TaxID=1036182 RepID=A0A285JKW0_9ACTN|nr:hypothetical protein [Actinoplanes atraurantiacus]SNY60952.1 hypothetical protein SAMN05421748_12242 [Actinoplanes atraurantiacus]